MRGEIAWSQNDVQALLVNTCTRSRLGFGTFGAIKPSVKMEQEGQAWNQSWASPSHLRSRRARRRFKVASLRKRPAQRSVQTVAQEENFSPFFDFRPKKKNIDRDLPTLFSVTKGDFKKEKKKEHGSFKICMKAKLTKFKE